jgi:Uncharacterised nucleotidyltransferase
MTTPRAARAGDIRPEAQLLLSCARAQMDADTAARVRTLLQGDFDWPYVLRTARLHGMEPLVYWHLQAIDSTAVPQAFLQPLRTHFYQNATRNLFLTRELLTLLHRFTGHGISVIPYKGPILALSLYRNLALRQFGDLDIVVRKADVPRAKGLMISLGYRPSLQLTAAQEAAYFQSQCQYSFTRDHGRVLVELHWDITPRHFTFPLDLERVWERLEPMSLAEATVLTFPLEDLLLILCVHGAKHLWERLEWICGVAELLRMGNRLAWMGVMARARELGSERMLCLGLFLASDLLGAPLPGEIWHRVQADPIVQALAGKVRERLFLEPHVPPGVFDRIRFHLRAREHVRSRLQYGLRLATTLSPGDWAIPLPTWLFPCYYLLRPIRLAGKYGLGGLRRDTQGSEHPREDGSSGEPSSAA